MKLGLSQFIDEEVSVMAQSLIVLSSITYAYKAQKMLDQMWIKSTVIRTPRPYSNKGCGYSLLIRDSLSEAVTALKEAGIRILDVIPDYQP